MIKIKPIIMYSFLAATFIILPGCSTMQTKVSEDFKLKSTPLRAAVLPFNLKMKADDEENHAGLFRRIFYNYFSVLGYIDLDIDVVDKILAENELTSIEEVYLVSPEYLGRILNVDLLVYCNISKISNFTTGLYAETSILAELEMVDAQSLSTVWESNSQEKDISGILQPASIVTLIQKQIKNSKKEEAITRVAQEFSKKIVKTIPDPAPLIAENISLPEIHSLETNLDDGPVKEGFVVEVYLSGEKGAIASFDIGDWKTNIPMWEKSPGNYFGSYAVKKSDDVERALIIGKLESAYGLISKKIYEKRLAWFNPT